jgi:3-dehydroquinate dehydratase/shikimate dehydrogenase
MNKVYIPLLVAGRRTEFNAFMDNILSRSWLDFRGFSVTIPHKENAIEYVKSKQGAVEPLAEKIGAANTIVIKGGKLSAYNTDCSAALDTITSALGIDGAGLRKMPVAIIGAGGVARAIVAGLVETKARVKIYNRTVERAKGLAHEFKCDYGGLDELRKLKANIIINCTSIGMSPEINATPVDAKYLKKDMAVFDTVYNPAETLFLKEAKALGCKTISGVEMFIKQAALQFKLFTGSDANCELMRKAVFAK